MLHDYDDDGDHFHDHHHSYDEQIAFDSAEALYGSSELAQKRLDRPYRPRAGEILVKDSTYYQQSIAPQDRQWLHRRNYWPLIDNTVTSLAAKAVAGANDVKNLLKVNLLNHFDNVNAAVAHKKQKLKTILLTAAQDAANHHRPLLRGKHPWLGKHPLLPQKQRLVQNIKPPVVVHSKVKALPSTTISDGYMHTYDNNYVPPPYVTKGRHEKNPYAAMGVTSYKHFEDTILKELEEKEERKVEATIHTLFDDKFILQETLLGTKPAPEEDDADHDEWTPLNSSGGNIIPQQSTLFASGKPYPISELQGSVVRPFHDIRPVCEQQNDIIVSPTLFHPSGASSYHEQQAASNENSIKILPHESMKTKSRYAASNKVNQHSKQQNQTGSALKHGPTSTTERPNYPAYFLKQQQQVKKNQQKLMHSHRSISHGNKVLQRQKFGHQIHATAPTTASSLLFYPFNSTDDGFRPIIPSDIASMRNIKPSRNTATDTTLIVDAVTTATTSYPIKKATTTARTTIQAQPSNVRVSIVAAPAKPTVTTTAAPKSIDTSTIRKTNTKKFTPSVKQSSTARNTTAAYKATQKTSRGSVKFNGSSLQLKR